MHMNTIIVSTKNSNYFVPLQQVMYCQIYSNKTIFYLASNEAIESNKNIAIYKSQLNTPKFFKANNYQLINMSYVDKITTLKQVAIVLKNQITISVDSSKKQELFQIIEKL